MVKIILPSGQRYFLTNILSLGQILVVIWRLQGQNKNILVLPIGLFFAICTPLSIHTQKSNWGSMSYMFIITIGKYSFHILGGMLPKLLFGVHSLNMGGKHSPKMVKLRLKIKHFLAVLHSFDHQISSKVYPKSIKTKIEKRIWFLLFPSTLHLL